MDHIQASATRSPGDLWRRFVGEYKYLHSILITLSTNPEPRYISEPPVVDTRALLATTTRSGKTAGIPSYGVQPHLEWRRAARTGSTSGRKRAKSARSPGANPAGRMPRIRAGPVDVSAIRRSSGNAPSRARARRSGSMVSTPGRPDGASCERPRLLLRRVRRMVRGQCIDHGKAGHEGVTADSAPKRRVHPTAPVARGKPLAIEEEVMRRHLDRCICRIGRTGSHRARSGGSSGDGARAARARGYAGALATSPAAGLRRSCSSRVAGVPGSGSSRWRVARALSAPIRWNAAARAASPIASQ